MWPFSSPRNSYHETIAAKRARRTEAIEPAPPFNPGVHQKYLNATGNCTAFDIVFILPFSALSASPSHGSLTFFFSLTAPEIVENIQARTWTASAVLEAYIARAAQAHQATNCFTEGTLMPCWSLLVQHQLALAARTWALTFATNIVVFFGEAIEEARRLDAEFSESGRLKGPLHGVPTSLKDLCAFFHTVGRVRVVHSVQGADSSDDIQSTSKASTARSDTRSGRTIQLSATLPYVHLSHLPVTHHSIVSVGRPATQSIDRRDTARSRRHHHREDERATSAGCPRERKPALGSHLQPVVGGAHSGRLFRRRGSASRRGWRRSRGWLRPRREHTRPVWVLRTLLSQAMSGTRVVRWHCRCVVGHSWSPAGFLTDWLPEFP
jgi:Amidase